MDAHEIKTYDQKMAEKAFECLQSVRSHGDAREYRSFAMSFPSLIHTCGLVQAVVFALIKNNGYLCDFASVLSVVEADLCGDNQGQNLNLSEKLAKLAREAQVMEYMRISRHALSAASWLKRYAQTLPERG
jgi:CRISPR-associated protein Cmr5